MIGVCLERGPDLVAALLGVLQAGAAYLPLDPDYPAQRIAYVLADAGCGLVLTDRRGASVLAPISGIDPLLLGGATVPIGGALDSTQLHVLDPRGSPVPIGVPGELCIGGAGLSPGYWRKPDLTAEKFISASPDRGAEDGKRLYRTSPSW